jgi:hypothetical protein
MAAAIAGIESQQSMESAAPGGIHDDEPGMIGFFVESAEDNHVVGVCGSAVESQHHRRGRGGVVPRRYMHQVAPAHALHFDGARMITRPQACVANGHERYDQGEKARLREPHGLPNAEAYQRRTTSAG